MLSRITIALFLVALLSSVGCKREIQQQPIKESDKYQLVDPYNDLIACLDGLHHTLYVLPEQRESVLKQLNASGSGDRYILEAATNIHHKQVPCGFLVKEASLNQLITISGFFDVARAWIPAYNESADKDTARGKLLDTLTRDGVFYRIYLNAQCVKIRDGKYTECEGQISGADLLFDSTKPYKPLVWKNVRERYYPISHCVKGSGSCVEALSVSMVTEYYTSDKCTGAPTKVEETSYDFTCP